MYRDHINVHIKKLLVVALLIYLSLSRTLDFSQDTYSYLNNFQCFIDGICPRQNGLFYVLILPLASLLASAKLTLTIVQVIIIFFFFSLLIRDKSSWFFLILAALVIYLAPTIYDGYEQHIRQSLALILFLHQFTVPHKRSGVRLALIIASVFMHPVIMLIIIPSYFFAIFFISRRLDNTRVFLILYFLIIISIFFSYLLSIEAYALEFKAIINSNYFMGDRSNFFAMAYLLFYLLYLSTVIVYSRMSAPHIIVFFILLYALSLYPILSDFSRILSISSLLHFFGSFRIRNNFASAIDVAVASIMSFIILIV